ncbi:MAG: DoxX family protein [Bacteroidetes bacterium]|nr:DoxX family protein [Bacteroidota bacterium]
MNDLGLLLLRIFAGGFMAFGHGYGKFVKFFSGEEIKFLDFLGIGMKASFFLAMSAEFFLAIFVILGLFTRTVTIPLIITMVVAAFIAHGDDPFQKKEMALLYLTVFGTLFFTGGGKYSISALLANKIPSANKAVSFLVK